MTNWKNVSIPCTNSFLTSHYPNGDECTSMNDTVNSNTYLFLDNYGKMDTHCLVWRVHKLSIKNNSSIKSVSIDNKFNKTSICI